MEQWEKNYYISSIAGATNGSSLVVMSKGWPFNISFMLNGSYDAFQECLRDLLVLRC